MSLQFIIWTISKLRTVKIYPKYERNERNCSAFFRILILCIPRIVDDGSIHSVETTKCYVKEAYGCQYPAYVKHPDNESIGNGYVNHIK